MGSGPVTTEVVAKGLVALDRERVSPSVSEPDSASLHDVGVASLSDWVKPGTGVEVTTVSTHWAPRGDWGGRARTDASRNLGGPAVWVGPNLRGEDISRARAWSGVGGARSSWEVG